MLALLALNLLACLQMPEEPGSRRARPSRPASAGCWRLPGLLRLVLAAGLIQVSHALYYGFASLHWRAGGLGETVIGWLWAEGVVAEVLLFAAAGAVLRKLDPPRLLTLAGGLAVLRWCLTAAGSDLALLIPAQALHGASFGAVHLATMHQLRDRVPPELLASAQGFYAAIGTHCCSAWSRRSPAGSTPPSPATPSSPWPPSPSPAPGSAPPYARGMDELTPDGCRSVRQDLQRALPPPAEPHDVEVLVECERVADIQALHQGKAGAIDDAESLIGPFLRNFTTALKILSCHTDNGHDTAPQGIPKAHRRRASEPRGDQEPGLDNDMVGRG